MHYSLEMCHWHVCGVFYWMRFPSLHNQPLAIESKQDSTTKYARHMAKSQALFGLAMVLVGLFYAGSAHVLWFTAVSIVSYLFIHAVHIVPEKHLGNSAAILVLTITIGGQFVLPQGPAAAMLFYIFATKMLVYCASLRRGFVFIGIGVALYMLLPVLGFGFPAVTPVPESVSFLTLLSCAILALTIQFSKARETVSQTKELLEVTEKSIEKEMADISRRNLQLHEGNRSIERGTLFLKDTLAAEAQSTSKLSAKRDDQKRLTNAIHHDMREPLRGIVSFSQLIQRRLSKRPEADAVKEYLGFAIDGGQRMAKMLDDLLLYSKNNHSEVPVPINLFDLVSEVQDDLFDLIERSEATIKVEPLPSITGFETQLKQLFQNLLSNALKFRQESQPPKVIIRSAPVQADASKFVIEIRDNGVGIPANQLDKVFGLFNRAHEGESYEGSGVGLALCRRIAIAHAATLTVASEPGVGTAFFFTIPIGALKSSVEKKLDSLYNFERSIA